jgi:hypothetical protein
MFLHCSIILFEPIPAVFMAFVRPNPLLENRATLSTVFTLMGAVCFFAGTYLLWPETSSEEAAA